MRHSTIRLRGGANSTSSDFSVSLTAFAEPKLKVLDYSESLELIQVVDEKGQSLIPPPDVDGVPANVEVFGNNGSGSSPSHWELGATLHYPKNVGKRIAHFKAKTSVIVQTGTGVLETPLSAAKGVRRTVSGVRMVVRSADAGRAEVSVFRDGRTDAEWYATRMQLSAGDARLLNEQGQVVARAQSGLDIDDSPEGGRSDFRFRFARETGEDGTKEGKRKEKVASADAAATFQWQFPTESRELSLPMEFHDLPIP
jgi:hypothetical protein